MEKRTIEALKDGISVIYDATNLNIKDRQGILQAIDKHQINCIKVAYVIPTSFTMCQINGVHRKREVPYEVLTRMLHKFQIPIYQEGFSFIGIEGYNFDDFFDKSSIEHLSIQYRPLYILYKMRHFNQGTHYHKFSLLAHSIITYDEVLKQIAGKDGKNFPLKQAALLHDFGKLETKVMNDKGEYSYYAHANVGAYNLLQNLDQLGLYCYEQALYCVTLINYHMEPFGWETAKASTVEKKKRFFGEKMYNDLMILHKADTYASKGE